MRDRVLSGLTTMRALLTGGIKAILAIAALSTAAHWAMRIQREPATPSAVVAGLPDPATTGSIDPRRQERPAERQAALPAQPVAFPATAEKATAKARAPAAGLDQTHLAALIAGAGAEKPRAQKPAPKR